MFEEATLTVTRFQQNRKRGLFCDFKHLKSADKAYAWWRLQLHTCFTLQILHLFNFARNSLFYKSKKKQKTKVIQVAYGLFTRFDVALIKDP